MDTAENKWTLRKVQHGVYHIIMSTSTPAFGFPSPESLRKKEGNRRRVGERDPRKVAQEGRTDETEYLTNTVTVIDKWMDGWMERDGMGRDGIWTGWDGMRTGWDGTDGILEWDIGAWEPECRY